MYNPFSAYRVTLDWDGHIEEEGKGAVDYGMPVGTVLPACSSGVASYNYWSDAGYAVTITRPDGSWTRYCHGSNHGFPAPHDINERELTKMLSGNSGLSTGPHMHAYDVDQDGVRRPPFTTGGAFSGDGSKPFPIEEEEEEMAKTSGVAWVRSKDGKQLNALVNPVSGFFHSWEAPPSEYNNNIAAAFETGNFVLISEGHAAKLEADCAAVRPSTK